MRKSPDWLCRFLVLSIVAALPAVAMAEADSTFTFRSQRKSGQTDHVVVQLEVGGETSYTDEGKSRDEKMSVQCDLDYFEKTLDVPAEVDGVYRSIRDYQKASAVVKVGDGEFKPALRARHNLIAVEATQRAALLFSPDDNLTRDELDAIDVQPNDLLLDRLLPHDAVAVGDRWPQSRELMAAMLGLDEVSKTTVQSTLKEVTETVARFEIAGRVGGTIYGVSTSVEILGKYRFDLRTNRIDWLGMLVKEVRPISRVEDGVDVVSRLQILVTPAQEPASLADAAMAKLALKPTPERLNLTYESPSDGWCCQQDRCWYLYHKRAKSSAAVLLRSDRGVLVGQCNLSSLPQRDPEKLVSLEEFQEDVRRALDKSFGEFIEAAKAPNDANYQVYRVVMHGASSDVDMRWIYYLVADPQGRQVALTFAVEQKHVEQFADADKPLVQSLRFAEKENEKKDGAATEKETKK